MYHVPIVRNGIFQVCYDPVTTFFAVRESRQQRKEAKSAAQAADARQQAAVKELKQQQETASSQASEIVRRKRISKKKATNIYTDPLGIPGQAEVVRKTLLGV